MSDFNTLLTANEEQLLQRFYKCKEADKLPAVAQALKLRPEQLVCAVGFNCHASRLTELLPLLGYASFAALSEQRNAIFTADIYKHLSLDNVLMIYSAVKDNEHMLGQVQSLLKHRLEHIENRIEETINSHLIDKYKAEIRAIYHDRIVSIDFVEARLNRPDDGFRALLNEVSIIIDSKIIPAGDIFFRNSILPQEKRRILSMGVIPDELVETRLEDASIPVTEKQVLDEYLKLKRTS